MASYSLCPEPRYRLSKPRTYTTTASSSHLEPRADLSSPLSSKQSSPGLNFGKDETVSGAQMRQGLREHLFGDSQVSRRDDLSEGEEVSDTARGMRQRLSRTGTMLSKRASIRLSLNPQNRSSTSIARESSIPPEDEEEVATKIKQKAFRDKLASLNQPLHVTIENDGVEETIISPIRRRSMMTPGLATRHPSDILAKPPGLWKPVADPDNEYYYNRNLSESSPLARIAALDLANGVLNPESRSATPLDVDYGNLSGPGALRITNGVASPVPSMRSTNLSLRKSSLDLRDQTEYFSLSHARPSESRLAGLRLQEVRRSGEFADAYREYAKRQSGEISRGDSDRRPIHPRSSMSYEISAKPRNFEPGLVTETVRPKSKHMRSRSQVPIPRQSSLAAEDYMFDLSDNPFSTEATTKPNEFEDNLFEDQVSQHGVSLHNPQSQESDDEAVVFEYCGSFEQVRGASVRDFDSSPSNAENTHFGEMEPYEEPKPQNINNSDSGYSSGSSLRSINNPLQHARVEREPRLMTRQINNITVQNPTSPSIMKSLPPVLSSRPQIAPVPSATTKSSLFTWSYQNSSETIPTIISTETASSQTSTISRKLQKPRPKSQPPPSNRVAIQSHPDITAACLIPPIPIEVAERNARRMRDLPPLVHTLPSIDDEKVKPEIERSPPVSGPVRFPTPSQEDVQSVQPDETGKSRRVSMRQSLLGSNKAQKRHSYQATASTDDQVTIATLGDVTRSLGSGPYDAAFLTHPTRPQHSQRAYTGFHHISPSMPKAKSMVGMNDSEALEVSRLRTKYRTSSLDAVDAKLQSGPPLPEKRQFNDRGGIPGKMPRLSTLPQEQPPLPSIPVAVQVQMRETQIVDLSYDQGVAPRPAAQRKAHSMIIQPSNPTPSKQPVIDWSSSREAWAKHRKDAGDALADTSSRYMAEERARTDREVTLPQVMDRPSRWSLPSAERDQYGVGRSRVDRLRAEGQSSPTRRSLQLSDQQPSAAGQVYLYSSSTSKLPSSHSAEVEPRFPTPSPRPEGFNIPAGTVARLSGRFDGGLGYGYEPGQGVGGSAGTRNLPSKASRKSIEVSKGFGLDLSDIPVFISPNY